MGDGSDTDVDSVSCRVTDVRVRDSLRDAVRLTDAEKVAATVSVPVDVSVGVGGGVIVALAVIATDDVAEMGGLAVPVRVMVVVLLP